MRILLPRRFDGLERRRGHRLHGLELRVGVQRPEAAGGEGRVARVPALVCRERPRGLLRGELLEPRLERIAPLGLAPVGVVGEGVGEGRVHRAQLDDVEAREAEGRQDRRVQPRGVARGHHQKGQD